MKFKDEKGSMAAYVAIVLLTMLLIITAVYFLSNSAVKNQLITSMKVKETYEADNDKAADIYSALMKKNEDKYVFIEDFDTLPNYPMSNTEMSLNDGILTLKPTGIDPMIFMNNVTSFSPLEYRYIDVRYRVIEGNDMMEFFMIENPADQTYSCRASLENDGNWHVLTIDLWSNEAVKQRETITGWRWDWVAGTQTSIQVDYIKIRK